ncbi:MAG: four helix bundle protein [bacterium]|nr:four helix bundle protein [bacterium]
MEQGFRSLIVWQKAMLLADEIYRLTKSFPASEQYGLTSQMRRAAISIPSNIAEGSRRSTKRDYAHFLRIACGSTAEIETQLELAKRWYPTINEKHALSVSSEIGKMLSVMIRKLSD